MSGFFTTRGAVFTAVVTVLMYTGIGYDSQYVFTAESMHEIANAAIKEGNGDLQTTFDLVVSKLNTTYPKYVIVALDSSPLPNPRLPNGRLLHEGVRDEHAECAELRDHCSVRSAGFQHDAMLTVSAARRSYGLLASSTLHRDPQWRGRSLVRTHRRWMRAGSHRGRAAA
jgi:hypothetical protein